MKTIKKSWIITIVFMFLFISVIFNLEASKQSANNTMQWLDRTYSVIYYKISGEDSPEKDFEKLTVIYYEYGPNLTDQQFAQMTAEIHEFWRIQTLRSKIKDEVIFSSKRAPEAYEMMERIE